MSSVEQVTYSFVNFYYGKLHGSPNELFHAYTKDAVLTHSKIPSNVEEQEIINKSIETEEVSSKQEIEKFYSNSNIQNCKIRVSSIDFQEISASHSILISIIGELALTDESPVYRFTQQFILVPGNVANAYDISNDIFRLIPDDDFELNQENVEPVKHVADEVKKEDKETPKVNGEIKKEEEPVKEEITPESIKEEPKVIEPESVKEKVQEVPNEEEEEEEEEEKPREEVKEESNQEKKDVKEETTAVKKEEPIKKSWAQVSSVAASSPPVIPTKPKTKATITTTTTTTTTTSAPKESKEASPKQPLQNITNQKPQRKKFEHLYPVLIKGTEILSAQELKIALEEEFGKTTKVEPRGNFALADFELEKAQQMALSTKHLKIGKSTITIEQKGKKHEFKDRKPNTNNTNNNTTTTNNNNTNNKNNGQRPNNNANFPKKKTANKSN